MNVVLLSVSEFAIYLGKSPQRVYQLIHEGLLDEVGITVYRTRNGRVWLRTIAAASETCPWQEKGGLAGQLQKGELKTPVSTFVCGRA